MLKHMEDDGDVNILFSSDGSLLAVCSKCKKIWTVELKVTELPRHQADPKIANILKDARVINLPLLKKMGINL